MIELFHKATDNQVMGSILYVESVLRMFRQDRRTGFIEVRYSPEAQSILLYARGAIVTGYRVEGDVCFEAPFDLLKGELVGKEALVRSVELPEIAVRMAKQLLEWFPPSQSFSLGSEDLPRYLQSCQAKNLNMLMHISGKDIEGYIILRDGVPLSPESVFATPSGMNIGTADLRQFLDTRTTSRLSLYDIRPSTPTAEQYDLRVAAMSWSKHILTRYNLLVGRRLTDAMNTSLTDLMRLNSLSIQVADNTIVDHHIFSSLDTARVAYSLLFQNLEDEMIQMIGTGILTRIYYDVFDILDLNDREILTRHKLLPELLSDQITNA